MTCSIRYTPDTLATSRSSVRPSATAKPTGFDAVAKATYADVKAAENTQGDPALAQAKVLEKAEFFKQSRKVAKRWWNQTSGKGHDTAPVIKPNFNAALRRLSCSS